MITDKQLTRKVIQDIISAIKEGVRKCFKRRKNYGAVTPTFRNPIPPPERKPIPKQMLCDKCIHKPVCRFYFNGGIELPQLTFCCCYIKVDNPEDWIDKKVGADDEK